MRLMFISIGCLWMSVVFIFIGAHQRNQSPRFPAYERSQMDEFSKANPDSSTMGVAMAMNPLFETSLAILIAMVFTVGVIFSRSLIRTGWRLTLFIPIVFGLGCLGGACASIVAGFQDGILWRFVVLGLGEWLAAFGLAGGAALIGNELFAQRNWKSGRVFRRIISRGNGEGISSFRRES